MKEIIKELYEHNKIQKITKNKHKAEYKELINYIYMLTSHLLDNSSIPERCYHIYHNITSPVRCKFCNSLMKYKAKTYICNDKSCMKTRREQKKRETFKKKYGTENIRDVDAINNKIKQTCLERYGTIHIQQNEKIKNKRKETIASIENFYENNTAKSNQTCLQKYGVEYAAQSDGVIEKIKETMHNRFGMHHSKLDSHRKHISNLNKKNVESWLSKIEKTMITKYGFRSALQVPEILEKQQKSLFLIKRHKNGLLYQGSYEKDFIDKYHTCITIEKCKHVLYEMNNKTYKYIPDFYIPSHNLIIEIKSQWTFDKWKEKNLAKEQACIKQGYNFMFIIDKNYDEFDKFIKIEI